MMEGFRRKAAIYGGLAAVLTAATAGSYALLAKFFRDRETVISDATRPQRIAAMRRDLERRRRENDPNRPAVPQQQAPGAPTAADAGQAAIQRQLRTLEEINRVNEMNRRLMEQQQRVQQQQKQR